MRAAVCLNRDLRTIQMFIMSCLYQLKVLQLTINKKCLPFPVRLQPNMHMYVSVYVHAHVYVCIYINVCICKHVKKCVIENTTYCYIYDKIQRDAITARSVFSKHYHNRHTMARPHGRDMGCLLWIKSLISYSISITTVLHTIWGWYSSAVWRHSSVCTNCTTLKGKKFLLTSGKGNMCWQYCGWDATKHHKIRECFSMALSSKDLLCFANKFRCIQSCDILHMQNIACLYNHWRLIVNISIKRFLILILIIFWYDANDSTTSVQVCNQDNSVHNSL